MSKDDEYEEFERNMIMGGLAAAAVLGAVWYTSKPPRLPKKCKRDLIGKNIVITGGNSGVGAATAKMLSHRGADILLGCRNIKTGEAVCKEINENSITNGDNDGYGRCIGVEKIDYSDWKTIENFAATTKNSFKDGIDILINNAGAMISKEERDIELSNINSSSSLGVGKPKNVNDTLKEQTIIDRSMVVNHLGWFELTKRLYPLLSSKSNNSNSSNNKSNNNNNNTNNNNNNNDKRIINVGSRLEKRAVFPSSVLDKSMDTSQQESLVLRWMLGDSHNPEKDSKKFSTFKAYSNAKLAMTASTLHLAELERMKNNDNIHVFLVTPGVVHTGLARYLPSWQQWLSYPIRRLLLRTPEQGAESVVHAATAPITPSLDTLETNTNKSVDFIRSGGYYASTKGKGCIEIKSSTMSQEKDAQRLIWNASETLVTWLNDIYDSNRSG